MPWKCPVCGYENPDDAEFCLKCGTARQSVAQVQPLAPPEQQPASEQQAQAPQPPQPVVVAAEQQPPPEVQAPPQPSPVQQPPPIPQQAVGRLYLQFIQTPAHQLNNLKIPLDFETFPNISVGRSPENVIVVPDPEVSRRHAVLSLENGELYVEDLNSTNGTYVFDGRVFQPIRGKQRVNLPAVLKLGNQTIVKVSRE
ncbi:MAG: FHA domain-containing protein [Thermoprotei archaeon]